MQSKLDPQAVKNAEVWLKGNYDEATKKEIDRLMKEDPEEFSDAFYKHLAFGTGGLRGVMGVGTNRMNKYTVGAATQGLANYLKKAFPGKKSLSAAIAYDNRDNNTTYAQITADVFSANGIKVFLFDDLRPTPELSFAIRYLGCQTGIVITASHNPREYNGYKVYWEDGAQLIDPHDKEVMREVQEIGSVEDIHFSGNASLQETIGESMDKAYIEAVCGLSLNPEVIIKQKDIKIVFTPLHGSAVKIIPRALKAMGFNNVIQVPEQDDTHSSFPTVKSPNPEEPEALEMAIQKAKETKADLVMGTDPDGDRVGLAIPGENGTYKLLNGNQTGALLINYLVSQWDKRQLIKGKEYIIKTIVTSDLLKDIANNYGVESYDTLTGFKYIAGLIGELEENKTFIAGGEESYGYLVGDFVRDKDAVSAACLLAEAAAYAKENKKTLTQELKDIHLQHGYYKETLISMVKKGKKGATEINKMMEKFRKNPPKTINNVTITRILDYEKSMEVNTETGNEYQIYFPKSNVLQFFLEDGSKITMRPSGTEPKIKFYISVKQDIFENDDYEATGEKLEGRIQNIRKDLGI